MPYQPERIMNTHTNRSRGNESTSRATSAMDRVGASAPERMPSTLPSCTCQTHATQAQAGKLPREWRTKAVSDSKAPLLEAINDVASNVLGSEDTATLRHETGLWGLELHLFLILRKSAVT